MSAIIMEYKYEHAAMSCTDRDLPEWDFVVIYVFDVEIGRFPVPCERYWAIGEREACEEAIIKWLKGTLDESSGTSKQD